MKYLFLSAIILMAGFMTPFAAMAAGDGSGKDIGVQIDLGGLYEQYSNNNTTGSQNSKTTTTTTNGIAALGYGFGHFYLGGTYFYNLGDMQTSGSTSSETKSTVNWIAPTAGFTYNNFRLYGGYVATATDGVASGVTTTNYGGGTGWFALASYTFYVSRMVYIAPTVIYYDVNFTSSTLNGVNLANTKYEVFTVQPLITIGFDF